MEFYELAMMRESTRKYTGEKIPREKLIECVEAARIAPSACNSQPWKFIIVDDEKLVEQFPGWLQREDSPINHFTRNCKNFVVVVEEKANLRDEVAQRFGSHQAFAEIDLGLAVENFCLQATALGIGTCIMGWLEQGEMKEALKIPEEATVRLVIAAGVSATERPRTKARKDLEEIMGINKY